MHLYFRLPLRRAVFLCVALLLGAALADAQSRQVTVWHYTRDESMAKLAAGFQARFPDIKVVLEHMGDWRGEKFFLHHAAGTGPDVVWSDGTLVTSWALAGTIRPLTPWIERAGLGRLDFIPPGVGPGPVGRGDLGAAALRRCQLRPRLQPRSARGGRRGAAAHPSAARCHV